MKPASSYRRADWCACLEGALARRRSPQLTLEAEGAFEGLRSELGYEVETAKLCGLEVLRCLPAEADCAEDLTARGVQGERCPGAQAGCLEVLDDAGEPTSCRIDRADEHREPRADDLADRRLLAHLEFSPAKRNGGFCKRVMDDADHVGSRLPDSHVGEGRAGCIGAVFGHRYGNGRRGVRSGELARQSPDRLLLVKGLARELAFLGGRAGWTRVGRDHGFTHWSLVHDRSFEGLSSSRARCPGLARPWATAQQSRACCPAAPSAIASISGIDKPMRSGRRGFHLRCPRRATWHRHDTTRWARPEEPGGRPTHRDGRYATSIASPAI